MGGSDHALAVLSGMAVALGHGVDVDSLLADLASGVRRSLDADRVSVLLLDDHGRLSPAVAVARQQDEGLFQRFRQMPPIALDDLAGAREALAAGRAIVIDDAQSSPLVPTSWQRAFSLASLAIAPLSVDDEPGGVLVVERPSASAAVTPTHLALLEGMAALAGVAVTRLRHSTAANRVERVAAAFAAIRAARTPRAVAEHALGAMLETVKVSHGLLALLDDDTAEVVAVRGVGLPEPGRYPMTAVPAELLTTCRDAWDSPVRRPVGVTVGASRYVVVPVPSEGRLTALAVLPVPAPLPVAVAEELALLADISGLALRTLRVTGERDWFHAAARGTVDRADDGTRSATAVELARRLLAAADVQLTRVVADRGIARATGLPAATGAAARVLTRWRRTARAPKPAAAGSETAVAVVVDDRPAAALLVRLPPDRQLDDERIEVAARLVGGAVAADLAHHARAELERATAESEARAAVAERCYREAGKVLALLQDHLKSPAAHEPRMVAACRVIADQARRLVRDAATALAPTGRNPRLRAALVALTDQMFAHGGPEVVVRQAGRLPILEPAVQVALLRATRRLLVLLRDARVPAASIHLEVRGRVIAATLRTEQLLDVSPEPTGSGLHAAVRESRGWLHAVGGEVEVASTHPGAAST